MTKLGKKFQEAMKDPALQARLKSAAAAEGAGEEEEEEEEEEPTVLSLASEGEWGRELRRGNETVCRAAAAGADGYGWLAYSTWRRTCPVEGAHTSGAALSYPLIASHIPGDHSPHPPSAMPCRQRGGPEGAACQRGRGRGRQRA
jgi:hypothetical protein